MSVFAKVSSVEKYESIPRIRNDDKITTSTLCYAVLYVQRTRPLHPAPPRHLIPHFRKPQLCSELRLSPPSVPLHHNSEVEPALETSHVKTIVTNVSNKTLDNNKYFNVSEIYEEASVKSMRIGVRASETMDSSAIIFTNNDNDINNVPSNDSSYSGATQSAQ